MEKDHTKFIAICILIGIVITVTIGIFATVYVREVELERDKYYADKCVLVDKTKMAYGGEEFRYNCGDVK